MRGPWWCVGGAPEIARPPGVQIGHLEAWRQGKAAMRGASDQRAVQDRAPHGLASRDERDIDKVLDPGAGTDRPVRALMRLGDRAQLVGQVISDGEDPVWRADQAVDAQRGQRVGEVGLTAYRGADHDVNMERGETRAEVGAKPQPPPLYVLPAPLTRPPSAFFRSA